LRIEFPSARTKAETEDLWPGTPDGSFPCLIHCNHTTEQNAECSCSPHDLPAIRMPVMDEFVQSGTHCTACSNSLGFSSNPLPNPLNRPQGTRYKPDQIFYRVRSVRATSSIAGPCAQCT
jgi:hypothetical protein